MNIKSQLTEKLYEVLDDRDFVLGVISIVREEPENARGAGIY